VAQHEQHDLTEAFEPLPDSPTGGLTAQDRSHDQQQRDTVEAQKEAVGIAQKLSPLQQVQAQVHCAHPWHAATLVWLLEVLTVLL
jgi:hypothetical protein